MCTSTYRFIRSKCALHMHELVPLANKIDFENSLCSDTYLEGEGEREKNFYTIRNLIKGIVVLVRNDCVSNRFDKIINYPDIPLLN